MAIVNTVQGKLRGALTRTEDGTPYFEFLNIPYATPPIGNLRFKSPQPQDSWEGVKDVSTEDTTKVAPQHDISGMFGGQTIGTEDCLYLNVFTPTLPSSDSKVKLPVMVYIHGGGFVVGNGITKDEAGPQFLIQNDVVLVSINYRLNVYGFLSLDIPQAAGNMGLKDQTLALQWVRENIENFSGDRNNVTIFGISAGSASVEYHILSPSSKGLFHKAILQSGSTLNHWAHNYEPRKLLHCLLNELNYVGDQNNKKDVYEFLLHVEAQKLTKAAFKACDNCVQNRLCFGFVPTVEKDFSNGDAFLTIPPYVALRDGKFNKVPVVRGYCNREGILMATFKPHIFATYNSTKINVLDDSSFQLPRDDLDKYNSKFHDVYFKNNEQEKARMSFFGDIDFVAGVHLAAKLTANYNVPQHVYEFTYNGTLNMLKILMGIKCDGACHGDDTGYLFYMKKAAEVKITDTDELVRRRMTRMWTNFAKYTNPTPTTDDTITSRWPAYTIQAPIYINIGADVKVVLTGYEPKKMALFEEIYKKSEQLNN